MQLVRAAPFLLAGLVWAAPSAAAQTGLVSICAGSREQCVPICSGFALSPHVIVTARHCVSPSEDRITTCAAAVSSRDFLTDRWVSLASQKASFRRNITNVTFVRSSGVCGHDLVFAMVKEPVVGVEATAPFVGISPTKGLGLRRYSPVKGRDTVTEKAFNGLDFQCDPGTLARCAESLGAVGLASNENILPVEACLGDSGGGVFDSGGQLLGLTTRSTTPKREEACGQAVVTLLRPHLMLAGKLVAADFGGKEPPAWVDDVARLGNSDEVPVGTIGMPCDEDAECSSGLTCESANEGLDYACTRSCESTACDPGSFCKKLGNRSLCVLGEAPTPESGGCSSTGRGRSTGAAALVAIAGLLACFRLRRRRPSAPWK